MARPVAGLIIVDASARYEVLIGTELGRWWQQLFIAYEAVETNE
jgi:hypothetical protein